MRHLGIFAKHWTPGSAKTRLGRTIGNDLAAEIHRGFVKVCVDRWNDLADRFELSFSPDDALEPFVADFPEVTIRPQGPGDLGERIARFFKAAQSQGSDQVVLVGSDSPSLPRSYVISAFEALSNHELVLGPTPDGGYYLVGLARLSDAATSDLFDGIPWSSSQTRERTVANGVRLGARIAELAPWPDVDEERDLSDLIRDSLQWSESLIREEKLAGLWDLLRALPIHLGGGGASE